MEILYRVAWHTKDGVLHDLFYSDKDRARERGIEQARELGKLSEGDAGLWDNTGMLYDASGSYAYVSVTDRTVF
jgi:hypothetical protein